MRYVLIISLLNFFLVFVLRAQDDSDFDLDITNQIEENQQLFTLEGQFLNLNFFETNHFVNKSYIQQIGSLNNTLVSQSGSNNLSNAISEGRNILVLLNQNGSGNQINASIKNYWLDTRTTVLTQNGENNKINLALFGNVAPIDVSIQNIKISQMGNGFEVEASMEDFFAPIEINQHAGIGGEGMKVVISNSMFNFPMKN